eukprot:3004615-Amphidinium_carterae.2
MDMLIGFEAKALPVQPPDQHRETNATPASRSLAIGGITFLDFSLVHLYGFACTLDCLMQSLKLQATLKVISKT